MREKILNAIGQDDFEKANEPMVEELTDEVKADLDKLVVRPQDSTSNIDECFYATNTFIDQLYLKQDGNPLHGIPLGIQLGITGLPSSGKSILIEEIAVNSAGDGNRTLLVTSEDAFNTGTGRMDLAKRLRQKTQLLHQSWENVTNNLVVLDTVTFSELRRWHTFARLYRHAIEANDIQLVLIDSVTLLETARGALKNRLQELCRYNQLHGITAIYVNQRATEDWDKRGMAGGIVLGHIFDSTLIIDYGSYWDDARIKADYEDYFGCPPKRKQELKIARVLGNRLGRFDARYKFVRITDDGFLKLADNGKQ